VGIKNAINPIFVEGEINVDKIIKPLLRENIEVDFINL